MSRGPRAAGRIQHVRHSRHATRPKIYDTAKAHPSGSRLHCRLPHLRHGSSTRTGARAGFINEDRNASKIHQQASSSAPDEVKGLALLPPTVMPCRFNDTWKPHRASSFRTPQGIVRNESGLCLEDIDTLGSPASDQQRSCHDAQTQTHGGIVFMNGRASTGSAVWWNVGFALCLVGVALSAPRWNWIFWVGALVYIVRTLVIVAKSYSSSKKSGHSPDEHPC